MTEKTYIVTLFNSFPFVDDETGVKLFYKRNRKYGVSQKVMDALLASHCQYKVHEVDHAQNEETPDRAVSVSSDSVPSASESDTGFGE